MDSGIGETFLRVELLRRKLLRPYFMELGLTVGQGQPRILKTLRSEGEMSQRELAQKCILDVTTMSRTLDRLSKAGLIERCNNPNCRRAFIISLTERGEELADRVIEIFNMADEVFARGISDKELVCFKEIMGRMALNLADASKEDTD